MKEWSAKNYDDLVQLFVKNFGLVPKKSEFYDMLFIGTESDAVINEIVIITKEYIIKKDLKLQDGLIPDNVEKEVRKRYDKLVLKIFR